MSSTPSGTFVRSALVVVHLTLVGCGITPVGSIAVVAPVGAEVAIDGHPRGTVGSDGLTLERVPTGARHLTVTLAGYMPGRATVVVERGQCVTIGLGPLDAAPAAPGAPPPAVGDAIALDQARSFYRAGDGAAALVVLEGRASAEVTALRCHVTLVLRLWREAERLLAAGDGDAQRAALERLLVVEPEAANAYHARARAIVR